MGTIAVSIFSCLGSDLGSGMDANASFSSARPATSRLDSPRCNGSALRGSAVSTKTHTTRYHTTTAPRFSEDGPVKAVGVEAPLISRWPDLVSKAGPSGTTAGQGALRDCRPIVRSA